MKNIPLTSEDLQNMKNNYKRKLNDILFQFNFLNKEDDVHVIKDEFDWLIYYIEALFSTSSLESITKAHEMLENNLHVYYQNWIDKKLPKEHDQSNPLEFDIFNTEYGYVDSICWDDLQSCVILNVGDHDILELSDLTKEELKLLFNQLQKKYGNT